MQDAKTGSPSPTLGIESNSTAPNIEHMPIYPSAQQVEVETHMTYPPWSKTSFQTTQPYLELYAYYKETLSNQGWLLINESTEQPALSYFWTDKSGVVITNFNLSLSFADLGPAGTSVHLFVRRWPDPTKVSAYPGATQIEVNYRKNEFDSWERVTTYKTGAVPEEVETYYKSRLLPPDWGWSHTADTITSAEGLKFYYFRGENAQGVDLNGRLQIIAREETADQTNVELRVNGAEIQPPSPVAPK